MPDDATLTAYEGEGIGLIVRKGNLTSWIDTGTKHDNADDSPEHDLTAFIGTNPQ